MFGNLGNMAKLMQQAKDIKKNMANMKEELAKSRYQAIDSNNLVKVTVTGEFEIINIEFLSPNLNGDAKQLSKIIKEATNKALSSAKEAAVEKMRELTGGVDIPGLF